MLGYLLRTVPVAVRARVRQDGRLISRLRRRVALQHVDLNLHMNQAAYAEVMELGRTDWLLRSGAWSRWRAAGSYPVVAEQRIIYRRELKPLEAYVLDTRAVALYGRFLVFDHYMLVGNQVHTHNQIKLIFVGSDKVVGADAVSVLCRGLVTEPLQIEDWRVIS
ncbi:MAG TPA: acyl-CoA thioesterase [Deltaproteobacteria bacterium]|nr:acyl-CoA thioesterase [Deltaproteobacteria bacterium]